MVGSISYTSSHSLSLSLKMVYRGRHDVNPTPVTAEISLETTISRVPNPMPRPVSLFIYVVGNLYRVIPQSFPHQRQHTRWS
jgi:hypothetical protein